LWRWRSELKVEKKEYQKPTLERLVLIPRENVLAVCYQGTGSGSYLNPNCSLVSPSGCFLPGVLREPGVP